MTTVTAAPAADGKIVCAFDGAHVHSIQTHIKNKPEWSLERYQTEYPGHPLLSEHAKQVLLDHRNKVQGMAIAAVAAGPVAKKTLAEVFGLGSVPATKNVRGDEIRCSYYVDVDPDLLQFIPEMDLNYVFQIDVLKDLLIGFELNKPILLWGYHGTGKTTLLEQVAARTRRPFFRVQHTINTEEAHIVGQYVVEDGSTKFQPGPLVIAMQRGLVYCADEYDFAMPSVLSVYQAVLEGKSLVIKDAPPELRVIKPHPNFRFVATGNTNGGGDESGLYQGTQIQNAAAYSRFGITVELGYMAEKVEALVISGQTGIDKPTADKMVKFAKDTREAFKSGKIASTVSPRELINAAEVGMIKGGDWQAGLRLALTSRMSRVDRQVVDELAQRHFGPPVAATAATTPVLGPRGRRN